MFLLTCLITVPPNATVQKNLMGAYEGQDAKIECLVESFPRPVSYWMKETTSKNYYHQSDKPRIKMLQQRFVTICLIVERFC